ncbi:uncharacterized protein [Chiloscyllium punctatum]|uniref:uncharacterized protein n=1 Tax=Chiloscyllium punctatum TaxID=137246 RepID=UPI003B64270D
MQAAVLTLCLVVMALASPVRKTRDASTSMENMNLNQLNPLGSPFQYRNLGPYGTRRNFINHFFNKRFPHYYNRNWGQNSGGYYPGQQFPFQHPNQQFPFQHPNQQFPFQHPNQQFPSYNPNQRYYWNAQNPGQFPYYQNVFPAYPVWRENVLGVNAAQMDAESMSAENSVSMEDTQITMPFGNVPVEPVMPGYEDPFLPGYGDPFLPGYEDPFLPDNDDSFLPGNEGSFTPSVDPNAVDVGVEQELETDVSNPEQPGLPYTDSVQGGDPLGSNVEDDSVISESHKGLNQQNTISEPTRLDVNHDGNMNNEQYANQQMSNGNLGEDDQTEQDETQNLGTNTMNMNPLPFSNDNDDDDDIESNLNIAEANDNELDSQEQDTTQSSEENLNEFNLPASNDDGVSDSEDNDSINPFVNNGADINQANTTDSNLHDDEINGNNFSDDNGPNINQVGNGDGAGEDDGSVTNNIQNEVNSCKNMHCRHGRVCKINEIGNPTCICQAVTSCPVNTPELAQVCGTNNMTYRNPCEFFASKCLLEETEEEHNIHLDYMGPCKYIAPCVDNELNEFPLRLRDWLKNILIHVYEQSPGLLSQKERTAIQEIYDDEQRLQPGDYSLAQLSDDFNQNYHMYIYPVHWQFQQLDQHPIDGVLSHSELAPLRTTLIPLEHCTADFFKGCDFDKDRGVSLREWGTCFGIKEEDINPNFIF